jgi:hypothetical protein
LLGVETRGIRRLGLWFRVVRNSNDGRGWALIEDVAGVSRRRNDFRRRLRGEGGSLLREVVDEVAASLGAKIRKTGRHTSPWVNIILWIIEDEWTAPDLGGRGVRFHAEWEFSSSLDLMSWRMQNKKEKGGGCKIYIFIAGEQKCSPGGALRVVRTKSARRRMEPHGNSKNLRKNVVNLA